MKRALVLGQWALDTIHKQPIDRYCLKDITYRLRMPQLEARQECQQAQQANAAHLLTSRHRSEASQFDA